mmetsp:Transcript_8982/g.22461  ORF Transcript_8982/g.22461 Transcript_8982/m.22461 type:complete len:179 (-) Transcript_8982:26-562(-)
MDPLAECVLEPGEPRTAVAVIELAVKPKETNALGDRARHVDEKLECAPCYRRHPIEKDLCIHSELYFISPDTPGHSYSRAALDKYTEAQRRVWEKEFSKPCDNFYRLRWSDNEGRGVVLADGANGRLEDGREFKERGYVADSNSHAHGDATPGEPLSDDVRRFMSAQQAGAFRPWEGR